MAWDNQIKFLTQTGKFTVLTIDNRGMGHSDAPVGLYTTKQMAADTIDILDHFGWTSNVHVNGVSMGGMISLELVHSQPERFASLTLTSTTATFNIPTWRAVTTISNLALLSNDPKTRVSVIVELLYPKEWLAGKPSDPTLGFNTNRDMASNRLVEHAKLSKQQTLHGHIGQVSACMRHYVSDKRLLYIRNNGPPVLIMTGTWDNLVRPRYSHLMHKVLGGHLEVFNGSGHALPEEQVEKYNNLFLEHMNAATLNKSVPANL
ncbi:Alpha/Beta hydrolase protein [Phycomyces nitens]|nr:Alpha/Beta hydrolase protein [Phycomyces nitens]